MSQQIENIPAFPEALSSSSGRANVHTAQIKFFNDKARKRHPVYKTDGAAGMDVAACLDIDVMLLPLERKAIPLGFGIELPLGSYLEISPRSGASLKEGLVAIQGTIDADYRGEVMAIVVNLSHVPITIRDGDRIAQAKYHPSVPRLALEEVLVLSDTVRGANGFGHTGKQ